MKTSVLLFCLFHLQLLAAAGREGLEVNKKCDVLFHAPTFKNVWPRPCTRWLQGDLI